MSGLHTTVLLDEAVNALFDDLSGDEVKHAAIDYIFVDATFGRGGHSAAILSRLGAAGKLVAFDRDASAIAAGAAWNEAQLTLVHAAFSNLSRELDALNIPQVNGILLDIGVSSPQLDEAERGFSFSKDAPLDMRMDASATSPSLSAADWLAQASETEIKTVISTYGEERHAGRIAAQIVATRNTEPITRTAQLAALVERAVPYRQPGHHPATRTFQAIRIHINQELQELEQVIKQAEQVLCVGGRLVIISFHSLEDRIVKQAFRPKPVSVEERHLPRSTAIHPWKEVARIKPNDAECKRNPRARSATMRVAIRQDTRMKAQA